MRKDFDRVAHGFYPGTPGRDCYHVDEGEGGTTPSSILGHVNMGTNPFIFNNKMDGVSDGDWTCTFDNSRV